VEAAVAAGAAAVVHWAAADDSVVAVAAAEVAGKAVRSQVEADSKTVDSSPEELAEHSFEEAAEHNFEEVAGILDMVHTHTVARTVEEGIAVDTGSLDAVAAAVVVVPAIAVVLEAATAVAGPALLPIASLRAWRPAPASREASTFLEDCA
jgi:hypothetical protein